MEGCSVGRLGFLMGFLLLVTVTAAVGVAAPAAPTAGTGGVTGSVSDNGGSLPGVVVELLGEKLPQPRSVMTDVAGRFTFDNVPEGVYTVRATFAGNSPVVVPNIKVKPGKPVQLEAIIFRSETVKVEAAAEPLVQKDTTTVGTSFVPQKLAELPTGRSYTEVLKLAPGVSGEDGTGGQVVYGSTGLESSYIIDGINTTSVESGLPSKKIGFDLIEKIEVKTGGYEAEFGGAQGAVVNVVTKSGSNIFGGGVGFYYQPQALAAAAQINGFGTSAPVPEDKEFSANLGGPIVRDRLFFFLSASQISQARLADQRHADLFGRSVAESNDKSNLYSAKLTWQLNPSHSLTATFLSDPRTNDLRDELGGVGGDRRIATGGMDATLLYRFLPTNNMIVEVQTGSHTEMNDTTPPPDQAAIYTIGPTRATSTPSIRVRETDQRVLLGEPSLKFGPYAYSGSSDANRWSLRGSVEGQWGNHDAKAGLEYEPADYRQHLEYGWGTGMALEWAPGGLTRTGIQEEIIGVRRCWGDGKGDCLDWNNQIRAKGASEGIRLFAQDRWQIVPGLTVNYGVRWETQQIKDDSGKSLVKISNEISPRFGVIWDPLANGKSKIYASAGRFYDSIPMQVVSRAFAPRITSTRLYRGRDWTSQNFVSDMFSNGICATNSPYDDSSSPTCWDFESHDLATNPNQTTGLIDQVHTSRGVGAGSRSFRPDTIFDSGSLYRAPIDPNLKGASTDEFILGYEWQFADKWVAGIKGIRRSLNNAIEDMSLDFGKNFIIGNPGGPYKFFVDPSNHDMWNPNFVPGSTDPAAQAGFAQTVGCRAGQICELSNQDLKHAGYDGFPKATREFKGLEFTLTRQVSGWFWFNSSYLYSRTEGNYRGRYFLESEERDPNMTEAFDTPALVVNNTGLLPQDRRHQFKVYGNFKPLPSLDVGVTYRLSSGTPYSLTTDPAGGSTPFFGPILLLQRGSAGTTPNTQNIDLRLAWVYQDTSKLRLSFILEVFNLLNEQKPVAVDEMFLAPGLWKNAFYSQVDGQVEFLQQGRGEPFDKYLDVVFGNGDGVVTRNEWNAWARSFQGRFGSAKELYHFLRNEQFNYTINGTTYSVPAYPGFSSCPANLPDNTASCQALNSGFGAARQLELPRSIRVGFRLDF